MLPMEGVADAISSDPDLRILAFTAAISIAAGLIFGLAPALQTTRPDVASTLKDQAANVLGGASQVTFRKVLVVAQVALSLLLLIASGLFIRSLRNLKDVDVGFRADHLMAFSINPSLNGYDTARSVALFDQLGERMRSLPGIGSVSITQTPLLAGEDEVSSVDVPGREPKESETAPNVDSVNPGFFSSMGIRMIEGREFTHADGASTPKVAVINESFAQEYFGHENPLGRHFFFAGDKKKTPVEIVGIVKDGKYENLREQKQRFVFCPYAQRYSSGPVTFYARTGQEPEAVTSALRRAVHESEVNAGRLKESGVYLEKLRALARANAGAWELSGDADPSRAREFYQRAYDLSADRRQRGRVREKLRKLSE